VVEFFVEEEKNRNTIQNEHLKTFPDIDKLFAKFYKVKNNKRHNANLSDCVKTYDMLSSLDNLYQFLISLDLPPEHRINTCYTGQIKKIFSKFEKLKEMIEESIDISKMREGEYIINPEFNEDLKALN
jgi:DNA mismatch repair protein MSH2